ncbi:type VI secretion system lipoprotein TssJ [Buttiauxella ferragutiae]|uniref:type VI secretion system lipoprotein TssJ n=1 Tax=Buttiauxella ferragutiae TaxID=82989 RepID=UPI0035251592
MNKKRHFIVLVVAMWLSGCSSHSSPALTKTQAIDQVASPFAQGAIILELLTDPDLNAWHDIANSCTLLVIQAQKASTLDKLLSDPFALKSLFSAAGAQNEILKVDRYAAMPGQNTTLHIDRSENTRYVAVVAGYYPFPKKQHMTIVAIPVTTESSGWWHPEWRAQLAPLTLSLRLGSDSITQLEVSPQIPVVSTPDKVPVPAEKSGKSQDISNNTDPLQPVTQEASSIIQDRASTAISSGGKGD